MEQLPTVIDYKKGDFENLAKTILVSPPSLGDAKLKFIYQIRLIVRIVYPRIVACFLVERYGDCEKNGLTGCPFSSIAAVHDGPDRGASR